MKRIASVALSAGCVLLTLAVAAFLIFILPVVVAGIRLVMILAR